MMVVDFSSATQWPGRMCFAQTRKHPSDTASCFTYRPLYWDDRKVSQQMPLREVTSIRLPEAPGDLMLHSLGVMNDDCCRMFVHYLERADGVKTSETSRFSNFGVRSPMPDLILPRARLRIELTRRVPVALPWTTDHHAKTMTIELLEPGGRADTVLGHNVAAANASSSLQPRPSIHTAYLPTLLQHRYRTTSLSLQHSNTSSAMPGRAGSDGPTVSMSCM